MNKFGAVVVGLILGGAVVYSAPLAWNYWHGSAYMRQHMAHHGTENGHIMQGGMMHDEENMPMLNGVNTTEQEADDLKALFKNHLAINRRVEMLPNGIKTVTESDEEAIRTALVNHVAGMINRVEVGDNPQIPIQSAMLTPIFEGGQTITTEINATETGVEVIQTSTDPVVVEALQKHATEVSDLAARGMQAVHEQMMARH